jgi:hypothetical protein
VETGNRADLLFNANSFSNGAVNLTAIILKHSMHLESFINMK